MKQRRLFMARLSGVVGVALAASSVSAIRAHAAVNDRDAMAVAERMRQLALEQGDRGYGAAVIKDRRVVAASPSRVITRGDPTAHAETEAVRDAARALGTTDLSGCILYSTSRACPMCEAAAYWGNIDGMIFGAGLTDAGAPQLHRC
ncbi:MAG: nucleoside deaminase [Rhodospirillaceae bacterium]|nr:nucleoside deaminase [Rhodospirillaceae bacterium]